MSNYSAKNCTQAEGQRAYYLSKMWSSPVLSAQRVAYEKKANQWAAIIEKCKAKGYQPVAATFKPSTSSSSSIIPGRAGSPSPVFKSSSGTAASSLPGTTPGTTSAEVPASFQATSSGPNWFLILGGVAVAGGAYYLYKRNKKGGAAAHGA